MTNAELNLPIDEKPLIESKSTLGVSLKPSPIKKLRSVVRVIATLKGGLKLAEKPDPIVESQELIYNKVSKYDETMATDKKKVKNVNIKSAK